MLIHHGSVSIIEKPIYGVGKLSNDYGRGFYCTEDRDLSMEWAVKDNHDGYANSYVLDDQGLNVLDLNGPGMTVLNWLAVLMTHRVFEVDLPMPREVKDYICKTFYVNVDEYDIVRGYRADDSYFSFAKDFVNGTISYKQLCKALYLGELGEQIVLKSEKAFDSLLFTEYKKSLAQVWYPKRRERDLRARNQYFDMRLNRDLYGEIFALDILREEMKPDDPRLS